MNGPGAKEGLAETAKKPAQGKGRAVESVT